MSRFAAKARGRVEGRISHPKNGEFWLEPGYVIEKVIGHRTWVTNVCETPEEDLYLLEAGFSYPYRFGEARLVRILPGGRTQVAAGDLNGPAVGLVWHEDAFLLTHRGTLSRITPGGERDDLVLGLPSAGDHHTGHIAVIDDIVYFGQGSATNAGVVGPDNLTPYGWLKTHPDFCDVPAFDVILSGIDYESPHVFDRRHGARTGAFLPFGTPARRGQTVWGSAKPTGVIYRCRLDGSRLRVYASGLRNPYGLAATPDGRLLCLDQGAQRRGLRPLPSPDVIWDVRAAAWYGFPDFLGGRPAPEIAEEMEAAGRHGFLLAGHPARQAPHVVVPVRHRGAVQMEFCADAAFGFPGQAFVARFGSTEAAGPASGSSTSSPGILRFDPASGQLHDFYRLEKDGSGVGPERPTAVRFSHDGRELYVADHGHSSQPKTGAVWRIRPE
jgi:hypothetical protein